MTQRLTQLLLSHWEEVEGYAVAHNLPDLEDMPLRRFTSFIWWYFTKGGSDQEVAKFKARLWRPPPGVEPDARSPWSAENESSAFAAFVSQAEGSAAKVL